MLYFYAFFISLLPKYDFHICPHLYFIIFRKYFINNSFFFLVLLVSCVRFWRIFLHKNLLFFSFLFFLVIEFFLWINGVRRQYYNRKELLYFITVYIVRLETVQILENVSLFLRHDTRKFTLQLNKWQKQKEEKWKWNTKTSDTFLTNTIADKIIWNRWKYDEKYKKKIK